MRGSAGCTIPTAPPMHAVNSGQHQRRRCRRARQAGHADQREADRQQTRRSEAIDEQAAGQAEQAHEQQRQARQQAGHGQRHAQVGDDERQRRSDREQRRAAVDRRQPGEREQSGLGASLRRGYAARIIEGVREARPRMKPNYRADHVGSLLRPQAVLDAHAAFGRKEISAEKLRSVEDAAILDALALQREVGLDVVSDGEFRRSDWAGDFAASVDGYVDATVPIPFQWRLQNDEGELPGGGPGRHQAHAATGRARHR